MKLRLVALLVSSVMFLGCEEEQAAPERIVHEAEVMESPAPESTRATGSATMPAVVHSPTTLPVTSPAVAVAEVIVPGTQPVRVTGSPVAVASVSIVLPRLETHTTAAPHSVDPPREAESPAVSTPEPAASVSRESDRIETSRIVRMDGIPVDHPREAPLILLDGKPIKMSWERSFVYVMEGAHLIEKCVRGPVLPGRLELVDTVWIRPTRLVNRATTGESVYQDVEFSLEGEMLILKDEAPKPVRRWKLVPSESVVTMFTYSQKLGTINPQPDEIGRHGWYRSFKRLEDLDEPQLESQKR